MSATLGKGKSSLGTKLFKIIAQDERKFAVLDGRFLYYAKALPSLLAIILFDILVY